MMRLIIVSLALLILLCSLAPAQTANVTSADSAAIRQAVLDFTEGYYSGDVVRVEKALHPDVNKCTPRDLAQTGRTAMGVSTYSGLVENTRAKVGQLADTAWHIQVQIFDIDGEIANVRILSGNFLDFVQVVKIDGQWKIVNSIYSAGSALPPRLPNFNPDQERASIERTGLDYLVGQFGADAKRLELTIDPEFNKVTLNPIAATGKTSLRRQRYDAMIENSLAGLGKQDEVYRDFRASILGIEQGLAVVRVDAVGSYEFLQMYKTGSQWRIVNSYAKAKTNLTITQVMTLTVGLKVPEFKLPIYGGGEFSLSKFRGKNIMLVFPRGWIGTVWCPYCPYQYLELERLVKTDNIKSKYNLEVAFVLPYTSDRIKDWMEKFPEAMNTVEGVKNPNPAPAPGSIQEGYTKWAREAFPIKFDVKKDDPHTSIPVLVDDKQELSRQLKIYTGFWDGISSQQNIATVLIIDKNGTLQFKYIGQMTEDRPSVEYLMNFIKKM
jgi:thiol-disulfide isomerase/thioredoxin